MELADLDFLELTEKSKLEDFDCSIEGAVSIQVEDIASFLKEDALNYQKEKMANTYLFVDSKGCTKAFFSISNDCLNDMIDEKGIGNNIWNKLHRVIKLPNNKRIRQYPAIKIGRLGVHKDLHRTGISYQLMDFIKGWLIIDHKPACRFLLLDAINEPRQIKYYESNGFRFLMDSDSDKKTRIMFYDLLKLS